MLCKYVYSWSRNWTFQSQTNSPNHSYQQQQRCNNLQISMNSIQSNPQRRYCRSSCAIILPKRIMCSILLLFARIYRTQTRIHRRLKWCSTQQWVFGERNRRYRGHQCGTRDPQCQSPCSKNTNTQNSSHGIGPTLMRQNFSRWNVLKHYDKKKLNS